MGAVGEFLGFSGGDTGAQAASASAGFNQQAIDELRRQFGITQENLEPFLQAGVGQLPALLQGTSAGGLDTRLAEIFGTEGFQALTSERERAVEGALGAGGLTRSGFGVEQLAKVPAELGFAIEQLLTSRSQNLAGLGQTTGISLANLGAGTSGGIANLFQQTGQNISSGLVTDAQARAQANQNIIQTAANVFFSDPTLKENVVHISYINDLSLYQWDWIEKAKGTMIEKCGTIGFMADQVKKLYPQYVAEFCGFMCIDYPALLDELEAA